MIRLAWKGALAPALVLVLAGCAATIPPPQTREAFVESARPGGQPRSTGHVTVGRSYKAVVADAKEFSARCFKARATRPRKASSGEDGGATTYRAKVETVRREEAALSIQEEYADPRANSGAPPGGIFVLVAEIEAAGKKKTDVDIHHLSRGKIAEALARWLEGDKRQCPSPDGAP